MKKLSEVALESCASAPLSKEDLEKVLEVVRSPGWGIIRRWFIEPACTLGPTDIQHDVPESVEYQLGVFFGWEEFATGLELLESNAENTLDLVEGRHA
jgi:hypothetical protein